MLFKTPRYSVSTKCREGCVCKKHSEAVRGRTKRINQNREYSDDERRSRSDRMKQLWLNGTLRSRPWSDEQRAAIEAANRTEETHVARSDAAKKLFQDIDFRTRFLERQRAPEERRERAERARREHALGILKPKRGPSRPQLEMYQIIKEHYGDGAELEFAVNTGVSTRRIDVAIPELCLAFEYDGIRYHQGREVQDLERQRQLEACGWAVHRFTSLDEVRQHFLGVKNAVCGL